VDLQVFDGANAADVSAWEELVNRAPTPDVYYRPGYVRGFALTGEGRPLAVLVRRGSTETLFPLLIREFQVNGHRVMDGITPYGYGGLLSVSGPTPPEPATVRSVLEELREWARAFGLVTCTVRFHPLLDQNAWSSAALPADWVLRSPQRQTTAVELSQWDESRRFLSGMRRDRRYDLRHARAAFDTRISEGPGLGPDLDNFLRLYNDSMQRLGADRFFLFPREHYEHLARELGDRFVLITQLAGERPVAAGIVLLDRDFAHAHLAAESEEARQLGGPTQHLIAASEYARRRGCSWLHLGGGLANDDALWAFKRTFGGPTFHYSYTTVIADAVKYEALMAQGSLPWPYRIHQKSQSQACSVA
jgi:hypothetical protein